MDVTSAMVSLACLIIESPGKGKLIKHRKCSSWKQMTVAIGFLKCVSLYSHKLSRLRIHTAKQSVLLYFCLQQYRCTIGRNWLHIFIWGWFCFTHSTSTQVCNPPTEQKGQLSQARKSVCVTFPGRQNHSMLVNHYRTQLIILRVHMRISHLSPFPHATSLTSSHPYWRPPEHNLPFMRSPVNLETPVSQKLCSTICYSLLKQMIKLASLCCILPVDMDKWTHIETHLHKCIQLAEYVPGICKSLCSERGWPPDSSATQVCPRGRHRKHRRE